MRDFLSFRRMVTPVIIQIFFWIGVIGSVVAGLTLIFGGGTAEMSQAEAVGAGVVTLIFGPLAIRLYAELLIVVFRINETLTDISDQLGQ